MKSSASNTPLVQHNSNIVKIKRVQSLLKIRLHNLEYGRIKLGISRIVAIVTPDNVVSSKLVCKLGFEFENSFQKEPNLYKLDLYVFNR